MVQGDAYSIDVEITNEGQTLTPPGRLSGRDRAAEPRQDLSGRGHVFRRQISLSPHADGDIRSSYRLPHAGAREVPERRRDRLGDAAP